MRELKNAFRRFMANRYGWDELNTLLFVASFLCAWRGATTAMAIGPEALSYSFSWCSFAPTPGSEASAEKKTGPF